MIEKILKMLNSFCVSFTVVMIIYPIFSALGLFMPINNSIVFQILIICFMVALLQSLTLMLPIKSEFIHNFIQLIDMYLSVMILGAGVFEIFPLSVRGFVIPGIFGVIVFILVWIFKYVSAYKKVLEINNIIQNRQEN